MNKLHRANFIDFYSPSEEMIPDYFSTYGEVSKPCKDFIISRTKNGNILSLYSDDIWDFRPYRLAGDTGAARMIFTFIEEGSIKEESKWVMFLLLFVTEPEKRAGLTISTLLGYLKVIRKLAEFCNLKQKTFAEVFSTEAMISEFIFSLKTRNLLHNLSSVLSHLIKIPIHISGYQVITSSKFELISQKLSSSGKDQQHPVIPPKIFSALILELNSFIDIIHKNSENLFAFMDRVLESKDFGRSAAMHQKLKIRKKDYAPHFPEASEIYGLESLFSRYQVNNLPSFSTFLIRIQHAARLLIHIYTGMRHSEALSLSIDSLKIDNNVGIKTYKLTGHTSKLVGQKKKVSWITSKEIVKGYRVAEQLAKRSGMVVGLEKEQIPLFISLSYLGINNKQNYDEITIHRANASVKNSEVYSYLDQSKFIISNSSIELLEKINPFRAWESEKAFKLGSIWRFTTHQFRRSLAFYVAQSGNVSLPSLKRQLKHLSREMSVYYSQQGSSLNEEFDTDEHISRLIQREKPEFDAIAYLYNVIMSEEKLHGAHGMYVEKNIENRTQELFLQKNRIELIQQFKNGEIAYKETALGACTTTNACHQRVLRSIAACIKCERAVIKPSKLERVIEKQTIFVEELRQISKESVELRSEESELNELKKLQNRIKGGN